MKLSVLKVRYLNIFFSSCLLEVRTITWYAKGSIIDSKYTLSNKGLTRDNPRNVTSGKKFEKNSKFPRKNRAKMTLVK